jgi:hypothetical protein
MSLFATSIASFFGLESALLHFSLWIFVSELSSVDLHWDCFVLLPSRQLELLGLLPKASLVIKNHLTLHLVASFHWSMVVGHVSLLRMAWSIPY